MSKCEAGANIPYFNKTVCDGCFHKEVCGNKDYLTANYCPDKDSKCYCQDCKHFTRKGHHCAEFKTDVGTKDFCSYGEPRMPPTK